MARGSFTSLGLEEVTALRLIPPQPAQRTQFLAAERVDGGDAVLQPGDVQQPLAEIHLIHVSAHSSPTLSPCRYAITIMVTSRCP